MNRNDSNQTSRQQDELVKRLEEIRRQRLQGAENKSSASKPKTSDTAPSNRNRNKKANTNSKKKRTSKNSQSDQRTQTRSAETIKREDLTAASIKKDLTQPKKRRKRSKSKSPQAPDTLIERLSDSQNLAQTIALSEILSKPVALRKRRL